MLGRYVLFKTYDTMEAVMSLSLLPRIIVHSLTDLTPELLTRYGIRLLMLDFDNTIVPYTTDEPTERMERWLEQMEQSAIRLCVVSNSKKDRVRLFCAARNLDCITHAKKPFSRGIRQCLEKYGIPADSAALAGDQIFTDTLGANGMGVTSILVGAIDNHNIWLKGRHVLELPWIALAGSRRMEKKDD